MDNFEIDCLLRKNEIVLRHYTGEVYSCNTMPKNLISNKFYISNDKRSDASFDIPGHWIIFLVYTVCSPVKIRRS